MGEADIFDMLEYLTFLFGIYAAFNVGWCCGFIYLWFTMELAVVLMFLLF